MERQQIIDTLKSILLSADPAKRDSLDAIEENSNLTSDVGLSSIGMLYMILAIEETFSMRFDNVGMNDFVTLGDVVDYIEKKLK
ncbi:MAG: acyl carrier protein [Clostridia bacterium]|nr:acyl carrier protein [Clostridia bacterium]